MSPLFRAMFENTFNGRTVWISGHTGFKGSWLCEWLLLLGARIHGFALSPPTDPSLFKQLGLADRIGSHEIGDVRNADAVAASLTEARPDFVFHLAAQSLVRPSYREPADTFSTNVMGTVNVLEALRRLAHPCSAIFATTDKVYENREWAYGYRENDPLGGRDPYSASKAASEHAIAAYRSSYFSADSSLIRIASARAGNVIGGGDWAEDRIVPDAIRALRDGHAVSLRNPRATRPWQHVLEPLGGYLMLATKLASLKALPGSFNFGPEMGSNQPVSELIREILRHWHGEWHCLDQGDNLHEAGLLNLSTELAFHTLGWRPLVSFEETVRMTVDWYSQTILSSADPGELTRGQIAHYAIRAEGRRCCGDKPSPTSGK